MWNLLTKIFNWAKSVPSEANGNGSSSRVISLLVAFTLMGLMIAFFCVTHLLPTPDQFYGITALLGAANSGYVANKLSSIGKPTDSGANQGG
jgi:predicted permease